MERRNKGTPARIILASLVVPGFFFLRTYSPNPTEASQIEQVFSAETQADQRRPEIRGRDWRFPIHINNALDLLEQRDVNTYRFAIDNIGIIEELTPEHPVQRSVVYPWENPPRVVINEETRYAGTIWLASAIAHEACHADQYRRYRRDNPDLVVPFDTFSGREAELACLSLQRRVLESLGADQSLLNYIDQAANTTWWQHN